MLHVSTGFLSGFTVFFLGGGTFSSIICTDAHLPQACVCIQGVLYKWIHDHFMAVFIHKNEGCILCLGGAFLLSSVISGISETVHITCCFSSSSIFFKLTKLL